MRHSHTLTHTHTYPHTLKHTFKYTLLYPTGQQVHGVWNDTALVVLIQRRLGMGAVETVLRPALHALVVPVGVAAHRALRAGSRVRVN